MDNEHLTQKYVDLDERVTRHTEQIKTCFSQIDELKESSQKQTEILLALQRQGDAIEAVNEKIDHVSDGVDKLGNRVGQLEQEPADKWKKMRFEIIKYVVLAIVGVVVGYFLNGLGG